MHGKFNIQGTKTNSEKEIEAVQILTRKRHHPAPTSPEVDVNRRKKYKQSVVLGFFDF